VAEPGERQLLGAHSAARTVLRLHDGHVVPGLGEPDRRREPVRAGADHHGTAHRADAGTSPISTSVPSEG
jgi:hypothetical protein